MAWAPASKTEFTWAPGSQAEVSNVYRGHFAATFEQDWSCLAADLSGTSYDDPDLPAGGAGFHYLVTGENVCGESSAGSDSFGAPRTLQQACP